MKAIGGALLTAFGVVISIHALDRFKQGESWKVQTAIGFTLAGIGLSMVQS